MPEQESPITFGEWLRQRRDELRLTRQEYAGRIGCSISTLRKIEDGERRPSAQIAGLIAGSLNIPAEERATFVKVARGELSLDRLMPVSPATAEPNPARIHLPVLPTPMIGRQREVEQLSQLMNDPHCRLVTLVGPGGMGKTRLAIEAAAHLQDAFANGVFFIALSNINTPRLLVPVIADALGFPFQETSRIEPKLQLFSYLKEKQALLLMDNLEQLLAEPGIEVLGELLASAPQVKLLATSRESLGLSGEWVFEVQGLPVPDVNAAEVSGKDTSVELFLQRARRADVGFHVSPGDYPSIVRICQLVDGMPLGIELAAAWVRVLSCAEIAQEIKRGMDFLSESARDLPPRHRSMRAIFEHSWKLLEEVERGMLLRLSAFQGGFQREAAEIVAGASISGLSRLVTKSLVRRSGDGRYDLHELIRQFSAEQFAHYPDERETTRALHARYYLAYLCQADSRLRSSAQRETLAELTAEMDNFQAAWEWAAAHGEFVWLEQALVTAVLFYHTLGWWQGGIDLLDRTIQAMETAAEPLASARGTRIALGRMLAARAEFTTRIGQYEQAQVLLEHSLEILRPLNEPRVLVEPSMFLGGVMEMTGNYARAARLYAEALDIARTTGDRWFAAMCDTLQTGLLGNTQNLLDPESTYARSRSNLEEWRAIGDPRFIAMALNNFSWSALRLGRYNDARQALEEGALLCRSVGDRWGLGFSIRGMAIIAQKQDQHQDAISLFRKSQAIFTELGARQEVARLLADMSHSVLALGNETEARNAWQEALRLAQENQATLTMLDAIAGLASLYARQGDREFALELVLVVLGHPASIKETKDRAAHLRSELEEQLTSQQIETVWARAQARTFENIVGAMIA